MVTHPIPLFTRSTRQFIHLSTRIHLSPLVLSVCQLFVLVRRFVYPLVMPGLHYQINLIGLV